MNLTDYRNNLDFARSRTLGLLDEVEKRPDAMKALGFRPGPGRAPLAWQFMHLAATDDRHLHIRMNPQGPGEPDQPEYIRRFAFGSVPDDDTPTLDTIRGYLHARRAALLAFVGTLTDADLDRKPNEQATWTYREWLQTLAWHEGHHHGQAHLTFNLYKASTEAKP